MDKTARTIETYNLHASDFERKFMDFAADKKEVMDFGDLLNNKSRILVWQGNN